MKMQNYFGFEKEFFVTDKYGKLIVVPKELPMDSCGFLVEARSVPCGGSFESVHMLMAECDRIKIKATKAGVKLLDVSGAKVSNQLKREALALVGNKEVHQDIMSVYGDKIRYPNTPTAGLHIHFGKTEEF